MNEKNVFVAICVLWVIVCSNMYGQIKVADQLFSKIAPENSNIHFLNSIKDSKKHNILIYESFYNGGGVALGDINNDGLLDIYFGGNQVEDKLYLNKGDFIFEDITDQAGIKKKGGWSSGVTFADVNADGYLDIYVCKTLYDDFPDLRKNELYINNQDGTFTESASKWGLDNIWRSMQAVFLDFDKDGDLDMFLVNQPPNPGFLSPLSGTDWLNPLFSCILYENVGNAFVDISDKAGVRQKGYGLNASIADYNNDGWVDIYVTNDYDTPDFLYRNNGDGTFTNIINKSMRHISYFSMGSDAADIDNDGWIDIVSLDMVAEDNYRLKVNMSGMNPKQFWNIVNTGGHYQYMFNMLHLNNGNKRGSDMTFSDVGQLAGISRTDWSWTPLIADFDNDGFKDIFITNGIKKDLRNNDSKKQSEKYIKEVTDTYLKNNPNSGEVNIWDIIDYNKLIEILPSQKLNNYLFWNTGNYRFEQKQDVWGLGDLSFSTGAAYGDLDNDGDLDLIVSNVDEKPFLYKNNAIDNGKQRYLRVDLVDQERGKSVFGVKVKIEYGDQIQIIETSNSRGFYSSSENTVHFGLGKVKKIDKLTVDWSDGYKSELKNIKTNILITVDRKDANNIDSRNSEYQTIFHDKTNSSGIKFVHSENEYNDYIKEPLLPHKMSTLGPAGAVADINSDGLDDFYVGGASGQSGAMYIQNTDGKFEEIFIAALFLDKDYEDVGASFIDYDNDGDQDLYVVSGGNEFRIGSKMYQDRLYENIGKGRFEKTVNILPAFFESGSKVRQDDFDNDGDLDLFVAGRQMPGKYPFEASSYLFQNNQGVFKDVSLDLLPDLKNLGMVTDALWTDFDGDGDNDLFVVGEWMPLTIFVNNNGKFEKLKSKELSNQTGWWFSIEEGDFDNDGDMDYVVGNLGLNYKYKASIQEPFEVHVKDFDENGSIDIVLSYYENGISYPVRGRQCSSEQMPFIKDKFKKYKDFAKTSLMGIYTSEKLEEALNFKVNSFASIFIENKGDGNFKITELPTKAQFSSINDFVVKDFNGDKNLDILIIGNLFNSEIETPRNDAGTGLILLGDGENNFESISHLQSGFFSRKEGKESHSINTGDNQGILIINNSHKVEYFEFDK